MFSTRWRKVLRDLWHNKSRTLLVVLSIAVGVFAVGAVAGARAILARDLQSQYDQTADASARIFASGLDENFIDSIRRMPEIAEAQGRSLYLLRIKNEKVNSNLLLHGINDFGEIRVNTIDFISGERVPPWRQLLIESASIDLFKVQEGGTLIVELNDGKKRELRIAGTVHDLNAPPPRFANFGSAYVSMETLEWLSFPKTYSEMRIIVKENTNDRAYIQSVVDKIKERIEDSPPEANRRYFGNNIQQNPGKHFADEQIQTMLLILVALGALSLFLSAFLVINTISAVMQQQMKQIGIMKSIGGRGRQIGALYLGMVVIFGALSLLIAVPVGALGARAMTGYIAGLLNFEILTQGTPTDVLLLEIAVGLLVPLLAALVPIFSGTRMTVREAISSTGLGESSLKVSKLEGLSRQPSNLQTFKLATLLPRPLLISLRNTFRKKGRLALTLGTLILATAIFVSVFSVRDSLTGTLQDSLRYWSYDIEVTLAQPQSEERALNEVQQVPGVFYAEAWSNDTVRRVRENKTESRNISVIAVPGESKLIQPILVVGRWLQPDDENAIVINADVLADEPDLNVGDVVSLKFGQRQFPFQIVGIAQSTLTGQVRNPRTLYITREAYRRTLGLPRVVRTLVVVTEQHDAASQAAIAKEIDAQFRRALMRVDTYETITDRREQIAFQFNILVTFLIIMAGLLAAVGGLGLTGTMSMNVLDRTREIGVMRAIGASDKSIRQIVVVEGVLIGWLSWLIGSLFALPISKLLADQVGLAFIRRTLNYEFSLNGLLLWLGIVTVIAGLASFFPAWRASRLTVREVLAYE
jgi:putative ABC transport system permease protein